jgi:hypothetical protein
MFTDLLLKAIFMYQTAYTFEWGETLPLIYVNAWQEQMIKCWSSYVTSCGCPEIGHAPQKRGEVSTLMPKLRDMYNDKNALTTQRIFQKINKITHKTTREKMSLIMEMEKFDPENPKVVSLFSKFSFEDIKLVIFLMKNNRTDDLQWHDGQQTCVSMKKNGVFYRSETLLFTS